MATALKNAAMSGVDVRIVTFREFRIKSWFFIVTQSYYKELLLHGVKISSIYSGIFTFQKV